MKKTTHALVFSIAAASMMVLPACGSSSSSSGQVATPPGPCDLAAPNVNLTDENDSCEITTSNNVILGVVSCTIDGEVSSDVQGVVQVAPKFTFQLNGTTTIFRCANNQGHPVP